MTGTFAEAAALATGLMAYDPSDPLRQGYSIGNALIAVAERFDLDAAGVAVVADMLVKPLVECADKVSSEFTAESEDGSTVDWYDNEDLYPTIADLRAELVWFGRGLPKNAFVAE